MKKKTSFIIAGIIVLLILIGSIVLGKMLSKQPGTVTTVTPALTITPMDSPPVLYNEEKSKEMHQIFTTRPAISESDQTIRKNLITRQNPLLINDTATIEYLSAPDEFMVEIKSQNVEETKAKVVNWFIQQGMSKEGICKLPVVFYLNFNVANSLRDKNVTFNPIPSHC